MKIKAWSEKARKAAKVVGWKNGLSVTTGYQPGYLSAMSRGTVPTSKGAAEALAKALRLPASEFGQVAK
jgi:hypothetical protein